jgi:hypothetical protein
MNRRILISENERSRILGLHENRRMKEWGLINEQTRYIKDATGKVSILQGPLVVPQGSTVITQQDYETTLKTQQPAAVVPAPAPFIPNGYESVEACKADYNTTFLDGVSRKVFKQNYTVIQKKWLDSKCNGKLPCDKTGPSNTNLAMAICEGTFNMSGPVGTSGVQGTSGVAGTSGVQGTSGVAGTSGVQGTSGVAGTSGVIDTSNLASRSDLRQQYRQGKRDVRELKNELKQYQNTLQRLGAKMTPEQKAQYDTKIAQLQIQINQSAT